MAVIEFMTEPVFIVMTCSLFLVILQVSTIHDSDGFYDSLSLSQCCGSLLLAKFQVYIINDSDGVCDGTRFYLHALVVCF